MKFTYSINKELFGTNSFENFLGTIKCLQFIKENGQVKAKEIEEHGALVLNC